MSTKVRTAVASPEVPKKGWFSGGIVPDDIELLFKEFRFGSDPIGGYMRDGLPLRQLRIHASREPVKDDFKIGENPITGASVEFGNETDLDLCNYIGAGIFRLAEPRFNIKAQGSITSNEVSIRSPHPDRRFFQECLLIHAEAPSGQVTAALNGTEGLLLEASDSHITPLDLSGSATNTHLIVGTVVINDSFLQAL